MVIWLTAWIDCMVYSIFLYLFRIILWQMISSILERIPWNPEKYILLFKGEIFCRFLLSPLGSLSLFVSVSLFSFCFNDLSIGEGWVMKYPIIVEWVSMDVAYLLWGLQNVRSSEWHIHRWSIGLDGEDFLGGLQTVESVALGSAGMGGLQTVRSFALDAANFLVGLQTIEPSEAQGGWWSAPAELTWWKGRIHWVLGLFLGKMGADYPGFLGISSKPSYLRTS